VFVYTWVYIIGFKLEPKQVQRLKQVSRINV